MAEIARLFARYASLCRDVQRKAIELENYPDRQKRLRRFSSRETAEVLGVSASHLRNLVRENGFPPGEQSAGGRRSFTLAEMHAARSWLFRATRSRRSTGSSPPACASAACWPTPVTARARPSAGARACVASPGRSGS